MSLGDQSSWVRTSLCLHSVEIRRTNSSNPAMRIGLESHR